MNSTVQNLRPDSSSGLWHSIETFFERFKPAKTAEHPNPNPPQTVQPAAVANNAASATAIAAVPLRQHPVQAPVTPVSSSVETSAADSVPNHAEATDEVKGRVIEKEKIKPLEKIPFRLRFLRLSSKELLFFYSQLETLIDSGVTLIDSLLILQSQTKSKNVKLLYDKMVMHINAGLGLAETMYLFPKIFPSMQAALIEAGERSGNLKKVLNRIVLDMEGRQDFVRKIKGAMFYPVVLIVLALAMVAGMMIFVIPKVSELYEQSNAQLPVLTQTVIDLSDFVAEQYLYILLALVASLFFIFSFVKYTRPGQLMWENFVSLIPVFGTINKEKNLMIFAANLGMLLDSGVLIGEAFEITEKTMGNLHYQKELSKIRHGIIMGKEVSEMMGLEDIRVQKFKNNKLFPLQVAQMIHIGELTGNIAKMLDKIRENYHKSIDYRLKNISAMIEPIMIFIVALLVGSILLAVMLPFFYIGNTIS